MAGLSGDKLADRIGGIVTKQALSKYENDQMKPSGAVLVALSESLNVPVDYFYRPDTVQIPDFEFRKLTRLSKTDEVSIRQKALDFCERYFEIENLMNLEHPFANPFKERKAETQEDVENVAVKLRSLWNLGEYAVPNIVGLCEEHGIKILEIEAPVEFDGLSGNIDGYPEIFLNKNMQDITRKRFTVLHELSHLLLTFPDADSRKRERLCQHFAGAFLIPKDVFIKLLGEKRSELNLPELISIKETYGISIQAIVARACTLGIITEAHYQRFRVWINQHGYRINEPGNYIGIEQSNRFENLVMRAVSEEVISQSKSAALLNMDIASFRSKYLSNAD